MIICVQNRLIVVTLEGQFFVFDIFHLTAEYDNERLLDKYNDSLAKIQERGLIEEQDAEELMNDVDLDLEAEFD